MQLTELVTQRITERTGRRVRNLVVEIEADSVVLRGHTNSFHVKQLAQQSVRETLPHFQLKNAIVVD
ncbi:MAG: hypothetical protein RMJ56_05450 [Gemmataceae bacterium]|nr:hypothetical protein [Gemmata sp.]MDW8197034.1 hypothetical protein [Gemmataceae bacterium]